MTRHLVTVVVVAAWLGAAVLAAAVVAPAAFAVLPTRALAGALVGRVLPPLFVAGVVIGGAAAALQWSAGGRGVRLALPLLVAVACAAAQFAVGPRIARLRS